MAKKAKKPIKFVANKKTAKKQSRKQVEAVLTKGAIRKRKPAARPQPLPGMENLRIKALDDICHSIAEVRAEIAQGKMDDAGYQQTGLTLMRKHGKTTWQAAGVTLVRVPGEERLQVKTTRGGGATAENEDEVDEPNEAADAEGDVYAEDGPGDWDGEGRAHP